MEPNIDIESIDKKLIVPSRVIFDVCKYAHGSIIKFKVRLVGLGNIAWLFWDILADTASARTINILLGLAASKNLIRSAIDVKYYT